MKSVNFSAMVPPAMPVDSVFEPILGTTAADLNSFNVAGSQMITCEKLTPEGIIFPQLFEFYSHTTVFDFSIANNANPATSQAIAIVMCIKGGGGNGYQVVVSRGTTESRGALWLQKLKAGITTFPSPFIGTSGALFTADMHLKVHIVTSVNKSTNAVTISAKVQRLSDNFWVNSSGVWAATEVFAISVVDSTNTLDQGSASFWFYSSQIHEHFLWGVNSTAVAPPYFSRGSRTTPVITKGSTYNGFVGSALASPSVCFDGTQYVLTVGPWSVPADKWASIFFTSPDMVTWTYVNNSMLPPEGTDYIFGNAGIAWWQGKYWLAYGHYAKHDYTNMLIGLQWSTDLVTWTRVNHNILGFTQGFDVGISVNPVNNKLELAYGRLSANRNTQLSDSPDGTTWTHYGDLLPVPAWSGNDWGAAQIFYQGSVRYMANDCSPGITGDRRIVLHRSVNRDTTWEVVGYSMDRGTEAWENISVSDCGIIVADLKDGKGSVPRIIFVGSDRFTPEDDTNSSIGLATLDDFYNPKFKPTMSGTLAFDVNADGKLQLAEPTQRQLQFKP